jgi:galactokinase
MSEMGQKLPKLPRLPVDKSTTERVDRIVPRTDLTRCLGVRRTGPSGGGSAVAITASGRCSASYIPRVFVRESRKSASRKFATQICADQANAYSMFK